MSHALRVVKQGMIRGGDQETEGGRELLQRQNGPIEGIQVPVLPADEVVQHALGKEQDHAGDQVRIDIARLVVPVQTASEAGEARAALGSVAG